MRDIGRFLLTGFIWAVVGLIGIVAVNTGVGFGSVVIIALGLTFAYVTTRSLWGLENNNSDDASTSQRKRKRHEIQSEKIDMLMAMMDEDEKTAFKAALKQRLLDSTTRLSDDGEAPVALSDLLDDDEAQYRR